MSVKMDQSKNKAHTFHSNQCFNRKFSFVNKNIGALVFSLFRNGLCVI